jgi:hypothetical protein
LNISLWVAAVEEEVGMAAAAVPVVFFLGWCRRRAQAMRSKWEQGVRVRRHIQVPERRL